MTPANGLTGADGKAGPTVSWFRLFGASIGAGGRSYSHFLRWISGMSAITLATIIWGYGNVVIRQGESAIAPSVLLWMRFLVASAVMLPAVFQIRLSPRNWLLGLGTGVLLGMSVLAMGWSMMTLSVDEVAFITALYVVITPLGESLIRKSPPSKRVWSAVGLSLLGVALLVGRLTFHPQIGILWAFMAAVGVSGQIMATGALSNGVTSSQLSGLQSLGAAVALTVAVLFQGRVHPQIYDGIFRWNWAEWLEIGYMGVLATAVAVLLQTWGQKRISATEAALAFNIEPVWTAVFSWAVLSQGMAAAQVAGAVLIVGSLTLVKAPPRGPGGGA